MGRFLKNESQQDKTRAGKMMAAVGKAQSFASQQRHAIIVFSLNLTKSLREIQKHKFILPFTAIAKIFIDWHCVCRWFVCTRRWRHFGREPLPIL